MNTKRLVLTSMLIGMLWHSIPGNAEDIDLYGAVASVSDADLPNLLIVLDNAANWNASSASTCTYDDTGGSPSLGPTTGGIEQCVLNNAINALPVRADGSAVIKLGIMVYNKTGMDTLYGCNGSAVGGCLMSPLTAMTTSGKSALMATIKAWTSGGIQSNNEATGQAMQESWAYYAGKTGMSGTTYTSPALTGCAKNYVLFIGNAINTSGSPGDASGSPGARLTTTVDSNSSLTAAQKTDLKAIIQIPSGAYGTSAFTCSPASYSMPNHTEPSGLYADEWARYMNSVDLSAGDMPAAKKVVTYTIGVLSEDCKADYPALLTSMARLGGGDYFPSGSAADILQALLRVLNEIQATNSVFASASLPVSINTQGTYRNQIFMGMFRPDAAGAPRWNGNLKQYQLGYVASTQTVFLADAAGYDAISATTPINPRPGSCTSPATNTGFFDPCAASFWTCTNSTHSAALGTPYDALTTCSDPLLGFWANMPSGQGYAWDLPDGEVVEKGGAAQMLRLANLTGDNRNLYTECSSADCALSTTSFATSNLAINDAVLGTGPITISSITSATTVAASGTIPGISGATETISIISFSKGSGSTVTATVSATDLAKLAVGTQLRIATSQSKYNCDPCTVTSINTSTNTFTYNASNGNQAAPGPYTADVYANYVTVTRAAHGMSVGQTITFSDCTKYTALNGTVVPVSQLIDADNFTIATTMPLVNTGSDSACKYTPNTATVTTTTDHGLFSGAFVTIAGAGGSTTTPYTGYNGAWVVTVTNNTHFTYQYTAAAPLANFSGSATLTTTNVTRADLINWVRGLDNYGDEASICPPGSTAGVGNCPSPKVTVRPSIHGDVLHSRPVVLDYGGTPGLVVAFYGDNGGVFHAVNGNQTGSGAGSELWGFIPSEFFGKLKRLHDNNPVLKMPSTPPGIVPTPQNKDYFVDGPIGVYQVVDPTNFTTVKAHIYLTMRRGGRFIYALDVTTPTNPKLLWKRSNSGDFAELGQTWSQPKVALIKGYANPVLIFGAGYDATAEDAEPPTADTMGRGIFVVDAITGNLVWKVTYGASDTCPNAAGCTMSQMKYSIPSDVALLDIDGDGKIDRLYVGDMGGNVWRVDFEAEAGSPPVIESTPAYWKVQKLAALGCNGGPCSSGTTPRKIFYPPEVITASASTPPYDAVFVATGDREHPNYSTASQSACTVQNAAYLLTDTATSKGGNISTTITQANLFNATTELWKGTLEGTYQGYYVNFLGCEKAVNAPLVVAGNIYFGTSQTHAVVANACNDLLGTARGYTLTNPLLVCDTPSEACAKNWSFVTFAGGGLPPSPMAGVINIGPAGPQVPFCIGCGGTEGSSPLSALRPPLTVPTSRTRNYWYMRGK